MKIGKVTPVFAGIHHIGIRVEDIDMMSRFYVESADFETWGNAQSLAFLKTGVMLRSLNAGVRLVPTTADLKRRPVNEAGIAHICLQSTEVKSLSRRLASAGATFHCDLTDLGTGYLYSYSRDPEHNVTEIEGVTPVWTDAKPWMAHVNIACLDIGVMAAFYGRLLGHPAKVSPVLSRNPDLDAIADLKSVKFRMAWIAAENMQVELIQYFNPVPPVQSSRHAPDATGFSYVAFEVADLAFASRFLVECGGSLQEVDLIAGLAQGMDPEGNCLRLLSADALKVHNADISNLGDPAITQRFAEQHKTLTEIS